MQEILKTATDFFLSKDRRLSSKFGLVFTLAIGLLFSDYFFRFSDSYITKTKIEQIEKIEELLQKDSLGADAKKELTQIEKGVFQRKGFWDLVPSRASLISLIQRTINSQNAKSDTNNATKPIVIERDVFWHNITSGWIFWIVIIISPVLIFQNKLSGSTILSYLLADLLVAAIGYSFSYLFAFIPVLGHPVVNYIVNALLCTVLVLLLGVVAKKLKPKPQA